MILGEIKIDYFSILVLFIKN